MALNITSGILERYYGVINLRLGSIIGIQCACAIFFHEG
jgi:hypothetical protein